jgi:prepilin signal peptidase PulO-like enzyme (type II secretory pathway)
MAFNGATTPSIPMMMSGTVVGFALWESVRAEVSIRGTVRDVTPAVWYLAISGAFIGVLLSRVSSWRTSRQPIPFDSAVERRVVEWAQGGPGRALASGLDSAVFTHEERVQAWAALLADEEALPEGGAHDEELPGSILDDVEVLRILAEERVLYPGAAVWQENADTDRSLIRVVRPASVQRALWHALACGVGVGASAWLYANVHYLGDAKAGGESWGLLALVALVLGGVVIAAVDHDTLFLDVPALVVSGGVAWFAAVMCAQARDDRAALYGGVLVAIAWGGCFVLMNAMYKLIRGQTGLGFGDVLITLAAGGVPAVVSGEPMVGFGGILAAMILAMLWQTPKLVRKEIGKRDAFALGPFLACGWIASWFVLHLLGGV